mmetsp:Transcript_13769/g.11716  ORF Transcript_13769/g.11716 Transcript_13769/m.11716 type:complete len:438 (+) Transcript_13769:1077-2390(+)
MELFNQEDDKLDDETITNAAFVMVEIMSRRQNLLGGAGIEKYFNSKEFLDILFNRLFKSKLLTNNLTSILIGLLQLQLQIQVGGSEKVSVDDNLVFEYLANAIGDINDFLLEENKNQYETTYGLTTAPFGTSRLKLVEVLYYSVKLNVHKVCNELGLKNIYKTLMELMTKYPWNNMLHNLVEKIFVTTLESDSHILKKKLLNQANLLDFLVESTQETDYTMNNDQKRPTRKGYLGHITKIAKCIERLSENDSDIKTYIEDDKWKKFYEDYFKPSVTNDNVDLAGFSKKDSDDFSDENIHIGDYDQGKFISYYNQQGNEKDDSDEEVEDETNDSPEKDGVNDMDSWGKKDSNHHNSHAPSDKDLWSLGTYGSAFDKLDELQHEGNNSYLEFNRELEIIDLGPHNEEVLEAQYYGNHKFAKPIDQSINPDDLLKEFEDF